MDNVNIIHGNAGWLNFLFSHARLNILSQEEKDGGPQPAE